MIIYHTKQQQRMYRLPTEKIRLPVQTAVKRYARSMVVVSGANTRIRDGHKVKEHETLQIQSQMDQNMGQKIWPFARSKIGLFFQQQPELGNQFLEDVTLQNYLKRFLPHEVDQFCFIL